MNVFFFYRTVSGLFDVPLDDPKQRFSQKMRCKKIPSSLPKGRKKRSVRLPSPSISRSSRWSTAACAHHEPCTARLFARTRTHARPCAPPRLALAVHRRLPPIPRRDIRSDFVSEPRRRLREGESRLELGGRGRFLGRRVSGPRQVWSHRAPGFA